MGYWLGVTKNCGDTFTYHVYVPETHRVIARSVLRRFDSEDQPNVRMGRDSTFHSARNELSNTNGGYDIPLDHSYF